MKGILMKPEMIAATVEGRKTNTRRAEASLRGINKDPDKWKFLKAVNKAYPANVGDWWFQHKTQLTLCVIARPRYRVGETVYIKEKALYWVSPILEGVEYEKSSDWWSDCVYQDDPEIPALLADNGRLAMERTINQIVEGSPIVGKWEWKSPLHMPEHYARHFVFIEAVAPGRVQEMTDLDCEAEGVRPSVDGNGHDWRDNENGWHRTFRQLWDSINLKCPWESNPFCWVYQFRLI